MSSRDAAVPCEAQGGTFPKQAQSRIAVTQAGGGKSTFKALESFFSIGNKRKIELWENSGLSRQLTPVPLLSFRQGCFGGWVSLPQHDAPME